MNHIIDKLAIQITNQNFVDDINKIVIANKTDIQNIIIKIFDKHFSDKGIIEINKIILDVGTLSAKNFETELKRRINSLLDQKLGELVKNASFNEYIQQQPHLSNTKLLVLKDYLTKGINTTLTKGWDIDLNEPLKSYTLLIVKI